jgi:WD40 repeat protein
LCNKKERRDFEELILAQTLSQHNGTIWTMKFSHDGARLVTGGQDAILRVWKVAFSGDDSPTVETTTSASSFTEKKILENEPEQSYQVQSYPLLYY